MYQAAVARQRAGCSGGLIERYPERNRLVVTGQLLDSSQPEIFRRDVRVTLWNFGRRFVTLRTNKWGEFCGEIQDAAESMVSLKSFELPVTPRRATEKG